MTSAPSETRSIGLMLGSVLLFTVNALIIRGLSLHVPEANGWVASLLRGLVGMVVVVIGFGAKGLQLGHLFTNPLLACRGLLGGVGIIAFYLTIVHLGAARSIVINLSYPIFASLFASIWLKEHLPLRAWMWMLAGFTGLVIFMGLDLEKGINPYDAMAVLGAIAAGGVVTMIRQLRHRESTATIYASQCVAIALFALMPAAKPTLSLSPMALSLLVLAALVVAFAQLAMTHAYRTLSVAHGSSIQMLLPVVTAVGGYVFFGERFSAMEIGGAVLTLIATFQVVRHKASTPSLRLASVPKIK